MSAEMTAAGANTADLAIQDEVFNELTKTNSFLPRMELFTGKRELCGSGKFPINHFGLVVAKNQIKDLGLTVPAYLLAYRSRAIDFTPDEKGKLQSSFDAKSELFIRIKKQADTKMPEGTLNNCIAGIEWLAYHPIHKAMTIMCASKSWKAICQSMLVYMTNKKFVKFDSFWKTQGKFSWQAPKVEMLENGDFELPSIDEQAELIETFKNQEAYIDDKDLEGDVQVEGQTTGEGGR